MVGPMWSGQCGRANVVGPIVFRAGPGHNCCGPGPGLIIQFAGRVRAGSAQLLRARPGPGP